MPVLFPELWLVHEQSVDQGLKIAFTGLSILPQKILAEILLRLGQFCVYFVHPRMLFQRLEMFSSHGLNLLAESWNGNSQFLDKSLNGRIAINIVHEMPSISAVDPEKEILVAQPQICQSRRNQFLIGVRIAVLIVQIAADSCIFWIIPHQSKNSRFHKLTSCLCPNINALHQIKQEGGV